MLFVTTYTVRPFLSKAETKDLLDLFAAQGAAPGTIAHYVAADNSCGFTVVESDDIASGYAATLAYAEYVEFDTTPVLTIEEALPHMLEALK